MRFPGVHPRRSLPSPHLPLYFRAQRHKGYVVTIICKSGFRRQALKVKTSTLGVSGVCAPSSSNSVYWTNMTGQRYRLLISEFANLTSKFSLCVLGMRRRHLDDYSTFKFRWCNPQRFEVDLRTKYEHLYTKVLIGRRKNFIQQENQVQSCYIVPNATLSVHLNSEPGVSTAQ